MTSSRYLAKKFEFRSDNGSFDPIQVNDFLSAVDVTAFTNDDGHGYWGVKAGGGYYLVDADEANLVRPSALYHHTQVVPDWATHVIWFDK